MSRPAAPQPKVLPALGPSESDDGQQTLWLGLFPDSISAALLAQPDGVPAERLHSTLLFCGRRGQEDAAQLCLVARTLADRQPSFTVRLGHIERFGGEDDPVSAVALHADELADLRAAAESSLPAELQPDTTWPYTPHLTLGRALPDVDRLPTHIRFTELRVVHGGESTRFPLRD